MIDLKNYICLFPFQNLQIHKDENWVCCPHWLPTPIPNSETLKETWNNSEIWDIRKSIIDGSYKHCDSKSCPFLAQLVNFGNPTGPIVPTHKFPKKLSEAYNIDTGELSTNPSNVQLNFDMTCNYKCPSCRSEFIISDTKTQKGIKLRLDEIENEFASSIETLYTSTVGDPFASVPIRNFLRNFDKKKYPRLKNVHLHTNGSLWNRSMWDSLPAIRNYIRSCEISIDAGTRSTYENYTRIGGNWDIIIDNLKFISGIKTLLDIKISFVVQANNYKEMGTFLELMKDIFGTRSTLTIFFMKLQDWNSYSEADYQLQAVHLPIHPEHLQFVEEFNKICFEANIHHNLYEFINFEKTLM